MAPVIRIGAWHLSSASAHGTRRPHRRMAPVVRIGAWHLSSAPAQSVWCYYTQLHPSPLTTQHGVSLTTAQPLPSLSPAQDKEREQLQHHPIAADCSTPPPFSPAQDKEREQLRHQIAADRQAAKRAPPRPEWNNDWADLPAPREVWHPCMRPHLSPDWAELPAPREAWQAAMHPPHPGPDCCPTPRMSTPFEITPARHCAGGGQRG
eukprot:350413-Chlamydomonas_euryale.AAC.3